MDVFGFLTGISPWWWVAVALALGTVEVLTFSFFLIWPGLAALAVAIMLWMFPDASGSAQIFMFAILSAVFTLAGRHWVLTKKPESESPGLNNRASALIGRTVRLTEELSGGQLGTADVDGIRWRIRLDEPGAAAGAGESLHVVSADGMVLVLSPSPSGSTQPS